MSETRLARATDEASLYAFRRALQAGIPLHTPESPVTPRD